jgi:hypothetical protein
MREKSITYSMTKDYRVFGHSGCRDREGAKEYCQPNHGV